MKRSPIDAFTPQKIACLDGVHQCAWLKNKGGANGYLCCWNGERYSIIAKMPSDCHGYAPQSAAPFLFGIEDGGFSSFIGSAEEYSEYLRRLWI